MFLNKLDLYYNTLKHVKPIQLYHQVYYRLKNKFSGKDYKGTSEKIADLKFKKGISYPLSYKADGKFIFLNLEKQFFHINWSYSGYGKLWTYNLNYFEFLHQEGMTKKEGLRLIKDYISSRDCLKDGLEPYPTSLRGMNWIKFLIKKDIKDKEIDIFLYRNYLRLLNNLEYHLLANHLLENVLSLLFGAYYFQECHLYTKAKKILVQQLEEQVLLDGAHYELSPMYHQIILHRVLDCFNLVKNNPWKDRELLPLLKEKAEIMLGWLHEISFRNAEIPKLNDSADGIAATTTQILEYAEDLELKTKKIQLKASGYRKFANQSFEVVIDIGQIAPPYQPGHSHADSLQFVLNFKDKPVIVDTGVSTYRKNERRQMERSTVSHNTVTVNELNSSRVWGGFRIAGRAKVSILMDTEDQIAAFHNGYRRLGITHQRYFQLTSAQFKITDRVLGKVENAEVKGHLHLHPDVNIRKNKNSITIDNNLKLEFTGINNLEVKEYDFAVGFNKLKPAKKLEYTFSDKVQLIFHEKSITQ